MVIDLGITQGRDINLDIKKVVAYRHWCNKLWNAIKFAMKNLGDNFTPSAAVSVPQLPLACRWLLSRLSATTAAVNAAMEAYEFGSATQVCNDGLMCPLWASASRCRHMRACALGFWLLRG